MEYSTTLVGEAAVPWILREADTVVEFLKKKKTAPQLATTFQIKRNNQVIFYSEGTGGIVDTDEESDLRRV